MIIFYFDEIGCVVIIRKMVTITLRPIPTNICCTGEICNRKTYPCKIDKIANNKANKTVRDFKS